MKFATWNLLSRNKYQLAAIEFLIQEEKIDIACLQEVHPDTLIRLKQILPSDWSIEPSHSYRDNRQEILTLIISRIPPVRVVTAKFNFPLTHSRLARLYDLDYRESGYQYNEYVISNSSFRVFNVHLPFGASPKVRLTILKELLEQTEQGNAIICGDLNSFGYFPWKWLVNPLNGAAWEEYELHELEELKKLVTQFHLKLSAENLVTFPICRTHLDHIIIPERWSNYDCKVGGKRFGSDHAMVMLEEYEISR